MSMFMRTRMPLSYDVASLRNYWIFNPQNLKISFVTPS